MKDFAHLLLGKDLRSITKSNEVVQFVHDQQSFDELVDLLVHPQRTLVMRAADAIEKITLTHKEFLGPHKRQLLSLLKHAVNKELKWHLVQLIPRVRLSNGELKEVWEVFTDWVFDQTESKIVRVNSLQGLFELSRQFPQVKANFGRILSRLEHEPIPSLQARIRKLKKTKN